MQGPSIVFACAVLVATAGSNAQPHKACTEAPQLGTWALQSFVTEDSETKEETHLFGLHPSGYIYYGPDCRMYAILIKGDRRAPAGDVPTDVEKVELFSGFFSYAGSYTVDGDKVSHHIDASWNQAWTGTTQVRQFKIEGNTLRNRTMPSKNAMTGRQSISVQTYTRLE